MRTARQTKTRRARVATLTANRPARSTARSSRTRRGHAKRNPKMGFGRELVRNVRPTGSRKGPALLALVAGLGAAGAAAIKRRRGDDGQAPEHVLSPQSSGEPATVSPAAPVSDASTHAP